MEQLLDNNPKKMKGKTAVVALLILSLLLIGVGSMVDVTNSIISMTNAKDFSVLAIAHSIRNPAFSMISIIPIFLFIIYALFCYRKPNATILLPITFSAACLGSLVYFLDHVIAFISVVHGIVKDLSKYSIDFLDVSLDTYSENIVLFVINSLSYLSVAVCFIILTVAAFKGFKSRRLVGVFSSIGIAGQVLLGGFTAFSGIKYVVTTIIGINELENSGYVLSLGSDKYIYMDGMLIHFDIYVKSLENQMLNVSLSMVATLLTCLAVIAFLLAVLVFASKNEVPEIIESKKKANIDNIVIATETK